MRVYIDTSIILDYILQRKGRNDEPFGEYAGKFFSKAVYEGTPIIISDKVLEELYGNVPPQSTVMLFTWLKMNCQIKILPYAVSDLEKASALDLNNRNDALHSILAHDAGADYIVTRNIKDFRKFSVLIKAKLPEEI
jgi:predicted nucleic acid-binding protein